jgi:hypothetical protein
MNDRKPQIAYAPVDPNGDVCIDYIRQTIRATKLAAAPLSSWDAFEARGWRIKRVRIEIDE